MTPRSVAIPKNWKTFDFMTLFSVAIYPLLGVALLTTMVLLGVFLEAVSLNWWHLGLGLFTLSATVFVCNMGIGVLHRIMQHRAGDLTAPAAVLTMINCMIAMQGEVKHWVNYHSQHHRFADQPGDPHNPSEGKLWAWCGWILFRDKRDMSRPMALWLRESAVIRWMDKYYNPLSICVHVAVPAVIYALVWVFGGSLFMVGILHAAFILGRAVQFHATIYGINVLGHLKTPAWCDHFMALLTGGESFHDHHHDQPQSALHRPRRGIYNRIVDYNGTIILAMEKIGWIRNLKIAREFA